MKALLRREREMRFCAMASGLLPNLENTKSIRLFMYSKPFDFDRFWIAVIS